MGHQQPLKKYFKTLFIGSFQQEEKPSAASIYLPTQRDPQAKAVSTNSLLSRRKVVGLNNIAHE
jgi:hypothetical protein